MSNGNPNSSTLGCLTALSDKIYFKSFEFVAITYDELMVYLSAQKLIPSDRGFRKKSRKLPYIEECVADLEIDKTELY
ncbi:unnamed protein product [Schistosoma margrebowiei]|uniref:Uncharacterized protein n=1 Tax=Schistosoma margrebowiei TaxID=48269 RepID=A0A183MGK8_9TREM|nr:unnamed protein product [Schistosoma margrebowiei]